RSDTSAPELSRVHKTRSRRKAGTRRSIPEVRINGSRPSPGTQFRDSGLARAEGSASYVKNLRRQSALLGLFLGLDFGRGMTARDALHLVEQLMQRLIRRVGHLGEGAQEAIRARQLEQGFLAVLRRCRGDQHDVVE